MKDQFFEKIYREIEDYFLRNEEWFKQFFVLVEKFDHETDTFYYVEVDRLFFEKDNEIEAVLKFFNSSKAKGDLKDPCHHTSIIYEKYKNNTLSTNDFSLIDLQDYFKKVVDRTDEFIYFKKRMLELKINQYKTRNTYYFSFPLIGFTKLQGSVHILFEVEDSSLAELRIDAIFRNTVMIFTGIYERLYLNNFHSEISAYNYRMLSERSLQNLFLRELDYHRYYLNKDINQQKISQNKKPNLKDKTDIEYIKELIAKGETLNALNVLEEIGLGLGKELYVDIVTQKARLAKLGGQRKITSPY